MKANDSILVECEGTCKSQFKVQFEPFVRASVSKDLIPERLIKCCPYCQSEKVKIIEENIEL